MISVKVVLVYSCAIRERGEVQGKKIGVLGIVFNWEGLAQTVVNATQLSSLERGQTRVCLVDDQGLMLADTENQLTVEKLGLPDLAVLFSKSKGCQVADYRGCPHLIAHALSPGYETYSTGWLSVILQPLVLIERKP